MKRIGFWAVCTVLALLTLGRGQDPGKPAPHPDDFNGYAAPESLAVTGNPLDYAGSRINMNVRNFELPRGHEGYYRFNARFPIIDFVSNQPLYMKQWAEDQSEALTAAHEKRGIHAIVDAVNLLSGTSQEPRGGGNPPMSLDALDKTLKRSPFTPKFQKRLRSLHLCLHNAASLVGKGRRNLTSRDLRFFGANPGYYLLPDGKRMPSITGSVDTHMEFIERARRVGMEYIFQAAKVLSRGIQMYVNATRKYTAEDFYRDLSRSKETTRIGEGTCALTVAGLGDDVHDKDAVALIDLGGNDQWKNNAGGCSDQHACIALAVDHKGNDRYLAQGRRCVQGFGFLGTGFLVDMAGQDAYEAEHFCQGAGILGVGALWDLSGDDTFTAQAFCQGAAAFGLGALLEDKGEDRFDCATLGQGSGMTLGLGWISDLEGDDRYHLNIGPGKDRLGGMAGYGQGGGLSFRAMPWRGKLTPYGGVGLLFDNRGNDRYRAGGWNSQGGSYLMSLGALVDRAGNDHYTSGTGQGSGIHITNAILVDLAGHDVYEGGFRAGASGGDRSPGFLIDYSGNDIYKSRTSSYGTGCKPYAYSLFIDYRGNDTYICSRPKKEIRFNDWDSFGGVWPESEAHLWPYAVCLDLGGRDDYQVRNRKDDSERLSFGHGIHLDMEWDKGDVVGTVANPLPAYKDCAIPKSLKDGLLGPDLLALACENTFVRFQAIGRIIHRGEAALPALIKLLTVSTHCQLNRDALECVHTLLARKAVKDTTPLKALLKAADPEVRMLMADNYGCFGLAEGAASLVKALDDPDGEVRRFALRSLILLRSSKGCLKARRLALEDPTPLVRRMALRVLSLPHEGESPFPVFSEALEKDPVGFVRVAAARGLAGLDHPDSLALLQKASLSKDVYLQRAAARGRILHGDRAGIPILIRSMAFPSIDVFYNYNRNIPNDLAAYTGHDMPEKERYDRRKWMAWFEKNKASIDVAANVKAHRAFEEVNRTLSGLGEEDRIKTLEAFLVRFPGNRRAGKALARLLNSAAWNLVTAPKDSKTFDAVRGEKLARRAVELDAHPNYIDTLAEAMFAGGNREGAAKLCEETLKKHPGSRMFLNRLAKIRKLLANK